MHLDDEGTTTHTQGTVNFMVKWEPPPHLHQQLVTFVVVDCLITYNIILGRPALNVMKAHIRTFCEDMLVALPSGSWIILGDFSVPQIYYYTEVQPSKPSADPADEPELNMAPIDQLEEFGINLAHPKWKVCLSASPITITTKKSWMPLQSSLTFLHGLLQILASSSDPLWNTS